MWVKETAPAESETTAPRWVPRLRTLMGTSVFTLAAESFGALRTPDPQSSMTYGIPTKSWNVAIEYGIGSAFSARLL